MVSSAPLSYEELLAVLSSPDLREKLVHFAYNRCGNWGEAKDLAARAIAYVVETSGARWDRDRHPDLLGHLGGFVNRCIWADRVRGTTVQAAQKDDERKTRNGDPLEALEPEELEAESTRVARRLRVLRERLQADASRSSSSALRLLDLVLSGTFKVIDQAAALGVLPQDIEHSKEKIVGVINDLLAVESSHEAETSP